ncbi:hypothetical protein F4808DRAFT_417631 [Astrocystis sublimbata]|nr:hypothetical protein F4808DRAFT_417631 [Astrocystis sublimbata]
MVGWIKMAKSKICWTCWKTASGLTAIFALCIFLCRYYLNHAPTDHLHWLFRVPIMLLHFATVILAMVLIPLLVVKPLFDDEEWPIWHRHDHDADERQEELLAAAIAQLDEVRTEFRAQRNFLAAGGR